MIVFSRLKEVRGRGTELISMYVPDGRTADALAVLRDEAGKAENIKSRVTKLSVIAAIRSAMERVKMLPGGHFAVFVGETSDGWISTIVEAPKPLNSIIYRCGSTFHVEPLDAMQDKGPKYAIICIDLSDVNITVLQGTSLKTVYNNESTVPNKQSRGGQSNKRFEKNRHLAIVAWFKSCAEAATDILLDANIKGIILSGPGLTKNEFADTGYMHHELRKKIIGIVDVGYTGEQGVRETVQNAADLLRETALIKQRDSVGMFLRLLGKDGSVAYGKSDVINAVNVGRAKTVLITDSDDIIVAKCEETGAECIEVSTEFEEGKQLQAVFGGYAAILRY